ncbi:MAG: CoxG family protein [Alphaproteobacteria bacterium]
MELNSEHKINASREEVFAALNDPDILRQCIPGCESLEKLSETEMSATVVMKIGPVKAKFKGQVEISNLVPPESYTISGRGSGGAAGFAKGGADIKLLQDGTATLLQYRVTADVGGKLAQLGSRLMDSTARHLSGKFFTRFCELVEQGGEGEQPVERPAAEEAISVRKTNWLLIAGIIAAVIALVAIIS